MADGPVKTLHILNLGCGVQSTTLYLMSLKGELPDTSPLSEHVCGECLHFQDGMDRPCDRCGSVRVVLRSVAEIARGKVYDPEKDRPPIRFDYAVFADTQEEPRAVYHHLEWLRSLGGIPILTGTAGKLGDDLARGVNSTGQRFASIPAYTAKEEGGEEGRTRRQCTREYKTDVVEQVIRRQILGLGKGERVPKAVHVAQYLGLSFDEARRRARVMARFHAHPWASCHFPLFDLFVTRAECRAWLAKQAIPHTVPRSACTFCPFHSNAEWRELRDNDPEGWTRAVEVDEALRREGAIVNRGLDQRLYVHRSCVPLARADIDTPEPEFVRQRFSFSGLGVVEEDCEGMCGV